MAYFGIYCQWNIKKVSVENVSMTRSSISSQYMLQKLYQILNLVFPLDHICFYFHLKKSSTIFPTFHCIPCHISATYFECFNSYFLCDASQQVFGQFATCRVMSQTARLASYALMCKIYNGCDSLIGPISLVSI